MENSKTKIRKDIIQIAWPSIAEQTLIMTVSMVSMIFVGRISKEAITAVGMVNTIMFFLQTVFAGLSTGSTVITARVTGEGDNEKARQVLIQSLFMAIIAGLLVTIPCYIFLSGILKIFFSAAETEVMTIALIFLKIVLIGLPFLVIDIVIAGSLRGAGDTKTPMYVTMIVNVINLILCGTLIFGVSVGGNIIIPAYGIIGAAISVAISRFSGAFIRMLFLFTGRGKINLTFKDKFVINISLINRIIKVGLPSFMEQFVMQGGFLAMQVIVIALGTIASASWQVGVNVNNIPIMPIFGFGIAAVTMVGQSLGRKDPDAAETYAKETKNISMFAISILGIVIFALAYPLARLYTSDPEVIRLSVIVIRMFALSEPLLAILTVSSGVLRGAGDIMFVMVSSIVGLWIFRIFISYILCNYYGFGIYGVLLGTVIDYAVRSFMYTQRVRSGKWKLKCV